MKKLKTILVAVEVDETSRKALVRATRLARQFGSEIVLMHAIEPVYGADYEEHVSGVLPPWLEKLRAAVDDAGIVVRDVLCRRGRAFLEIMTAADDVDANLIVLGARSVAAPNQFALGTTAEKVMRKSARPVLVTHLEPPFDWANIVCPVDFSSASARALTNAVRLARAFRCKLHVLTVVPTSWAFRQLELQGAEWAAQAEKQALVVCTHEFDQFLSRFDLHDVQWDKAIERGEPAERIVAAVNARNADLVVMGAVGKTGLPQILMGHTALKLARQLPCSLLSVKHAEALIAKLEQDITDIHGANREGHTLLNRGFYEEALGRFEQCLRIDPFFAPALEGKAEVHERLGHAEQAKQYRKLAETIRQSLWGQSATADVREMHDEVLA